jgi:template-activating factor I
MPGIKRASPGADDEKNPLANVELKDEDAQNLQNIQKDIQRVELIVGERPSVSLQEINIQTNDLQERQAMQKLAPVYEKRRAVAKSIDKFWPVALMNNNMISFHAQHNIDQIALSYLEDLWIARDPKEPRCYTIEFVRCY